MEYCPLKTYSIGINSLDGHIFGWLRFGDNRNWITIDQSPIDLHFALTTKEGDLHDWWVYWWWWPTEPRLCYWRTS